MPPSTRPPGEPPAMAPPPAQPGTQTVAPAAAPEGARRLMACADDGGVAEALRPLADRARTKAEAVAECVGGWLEGEVQEFRDGVKREVGEFRAGFDKVRRGLYGLRSILRGAD